MYGLKASTPAEKQPLIRTNLKENGIYNQETLNFDVWITDYRGKALAYSDMEVTVNGEPADYIGEMSRQTYSTQLRSGANTISVKITDEYQYTVPQGVYGLLSDGKRNNYHQPGSRNDRYSLSGQTKEDRRGVRRIPFPCSG